MHEIEVTPGETFNVDVNLSTSGRRRQIWLYAKASESDIFEITGLTGETPWHGNNATGPLDPSSTSLIWGIPGPDYFGPGTGRLGTLSFAVAPAVQGTYALDLTVWYDAAGDWSLGTSGPSFEVRVVPEPASGLLILAACFFLRRPRKP